MENNSLKKPVDYFYKKTCGGMYTVYCKYDTGHVEVIFSTVRESTSKSLVFSLKEAIALE